TLSKFLLCGAVFAVSLSLVSPSAAEKTKKKKTSTPPVQHARAVPVSQSVRALKRQIEQIREAARRREKDEDAREKGQAALTVGQRKRSLTAKEKDEDEAVDAWGARLYYLQPRAFPNDTVDWSAYNRAEAARAKMK